jgi:hypothetical protein
MKEINAQYGKSGIRDSADQKIDQMRIAEQMMGCPLGWGFKTCLPQIPSSKCKLTNQIKNAQ